MANARSSVIPQACYPIVAATIAMAAVLVLNPVGYIGGGQDDTRYLAAARCWLENGICLPTNHWEARWPVFAPIAVITTVFQETRSTVQLWPLVSSVAAALLLVEISRRCFGGLVATFVAIPFVFLPAFALQLLTPSVEAVELTLILGGVIAIVKLRSFPAPLWAFLAGLCFGLAFQVRETSVVAAVLAFVALGATARKIELAHVVWAAFGFCVPLTVEFLAYQWATGDFFYRRQLAMAHAKIPSSELAPAIDTSGSPLLNRAIIGGWRREPGIMIHWLVDGPLNLLLNAKAGFSLLLAPLLLVLGRTHLDSRDRRMCWALLGIAWAYIATITYVLAMDPKPRVMLPGLAASTVAFGLVSARLWKAGRHLLIGTCLGAALVGCAALITGYLRPVWAEEQARQWSVSYPGSIEIDRGTRTYLTLSDDLRHLPGYGAGLPYTMSVSGSACPEWLDRAQLKNALAIVDTRKLSLLPQFGNSRRSHICLFRYRQFVTPERMEESARQALIKLQSAR